MSSGTRDELWLMELITRDGYLPSYILTPEQADEMERQGYRVARIPVARKPVHGGYIASDGEEYGWVDENGNAHNDPRQDNRYD